MRPSRSLAAVVLPVLGALASEGSSSSLSSSAVAKPTFTAPFLEQFTEDWESRWKPSNSKKVNDHTSEEEWAYVGAWSVEEPSVFKGMEGDKGLVVKSNAAHHAISSVFSKPIDNKGKTLVVQYEVKLQKGLECGGAYLKLLRDNKELHAEEFSNATPYVIMFGPDRCGGTNKVHFIFQHKNPKTGKHEEKHLVSPPLARMVKTTSLYTLIVRPDQTYEIRINGDKASSGSLLENFDPSVNPPAEIDDPKDVKPANWVETATIPDPDAKKPEDWDEDAPALIVDEDAVKPADWYENEEQMIEDPDATKPADWDDEEDGVWVPASIPNPKCETASGCGPWTRPRIANPNYKGRWSAPMIDNPEYKGVWKPRKIANPDYYEDKTPANFEPIGAIGFEIWTMQNEILFDNIYVGHSIEDAEALKKETFDQKIVVETAEYEESLPKMPEDNSAKSFKDDPVSFVTEKLFSFIDAAKQDPVFAISTMPDVAGAIAATVTVFLFLLSLVFSKSSSGQDAPSGPQKASKRVEAAENPEGTTTGVDVAAGKKPPQKRK